MTTDPIPDDILKAAQSICAEFNPSDTAICVAIMRERERCAKIAESERQRNDNAWDGEFSSGGAAAAETIRDAIRSPDKTP